MSYTVIGSLRSPFTRMTRLWLINNNIDFKFEIKNYLEVKEDAEYLARLSPINRIPVLMDNEKVIFDSRVIFNHINQKHKLMGLSIDEENILTAIQTCMDVSVNLFLLKKSGTNLEGGNWYIERQRERVKRCFEYILPWVQSLKVSDWNYPAMSLYSYLIWAKFRGVSEVPEHTDLNLFIGKFKNSRGVEETSFPI
ncbi:MAG: glutathione S-transferase family protein [Bdellovibrionota bacterium]